MRYKFLPNRLFYVSTVSDIINQKFDITPTSFKTTVVKPFSRTLSLDTNDLKNYRSYLKYPKLLEKGNPEKRVHRV